MSIKKRMTWLIMIDSLIVLTAIYMAYFILEPQINISTNRMFVTSVITIQVAHLFFSWRYALYRKTWSYASIGELKSIFKAVTLTNLTVLITQFLILQVIHLRAIILTWMLHILLLGFSRLSWRLIIDKINDRKRKTTDRTMIIGAGHAGRMVAQQLLQNPDSGMNPILFVDDDYAKYGLEIFGLKILIGTKRIPELVKTHKIQKIVIAISSLSTDEMAYLSRMCIDSGVKTQTVPHINELLKGKVTVNDMQDINIGDLLGREEVELDLKAIENKIYGKKILVTGAGGSIGSEICRQVSIFNPKQLILLGHGENSIYTIDMELRKKFTSQIEIIPIIADIKDRVGIFDIISKYKPDVIYHAAAHKHVPLMEINPIEAVKNNIFGTKNIAEAADLFDIPHFVMVSTDKAVNPTNIMGATKRFAEMLVQNLAKKSKTRFVAVRFGNVLGSRGSVVPLFREQIRQGGPITVTDPEMTRYFMTIPEASRLVIQAGTISSKGNIFVLDMGEPIKIVEMAKNLIKLSGYAEDEIKIEFSGVRPGEKLYEELLNESEIQNDYVFPKIHVGNANPISQDELDSIIESMLEMREEDVKSMLIQLANNKTVVGNA